MAAPAHTIQNSLGAYEYAAAVSKSDSTVLPPTRALFVGGTGDLTVTMAGDGEDVELTSVPAGTLLLIRVTKVKAATSATDVVALW